MTRSNAYVGRRTERIEDLRLLRGKGRFVDDIRLEGMLHAAVLRSPLAHGTIMDIDASAALELPGVHAVYTAADLGPAVPTIPVRLFPTPALEAFRQPVIAQSRVRYVGEPIALVVADTPGIAEDALELIFADIDPLDPVADIGLSDIDVWGAPSPATGVLFEGNAGNRALTLSFTKGSADPVFEAADYTRKESFYVHRHTGITMETRGVLAQWNAETQHMTVYGAAKVPFPNRKILAKLMDLPETSVDMIEGDAGGSFGVRGEFFPEDFLIPFAARTLGRPVKWIEDRREHFLAVSHARDVRCDVEIACRRDGTIEAMRGELRVDIGAYVRTTGIITPRNVGMFLTGPYRVPHVGIAVHMELSNKSPSGTYRGPGRFEADFFRERLFDMVAADLGIDRVAFRRRNLISGAEMPYAFPEVDPSPHGTALDSGAYETVMDMALEKAGWRDKQPLQGKLIDGRYHGLAVACFIEGGAAGPSENAKIAIDPGGDVAVYVGSSTVGQGVETTLSQVAADAMEVNLDRIKLYHGSTTYLSDGWGSYHSRSTVMGGSAILLCAEDLKPMIAAAGAASLGVDPSETSYSGGLVIASDGRSVGLADIDHADLAVERTFYNSKHTYSYGTHVAHVAVDIGTGHVEIVDYVSIEDPGVIVNPLTLHGQALGAIVQGLGGTLLEQLVYDENGQMLTASFADYLMPLATDFPNIRSYSVALCPSPNNPLGVKGAGEGGIIPVGGLIANAVANALQSFGIQPRSLPLSPPEICRLVWEAETAPA